MERKNLWMERKGPTPRGVKRLRHYIAERRDALNLTQTDLGDRIERSTSAVSRIETGETKLTQETIELIAWALGCDDPLDIFYPPATVATAEVTDLLQKMNPAQRRRAIRQLQAQVAPEAQPDRSTVTELPTRRKPAS